MKAKFINESIKDILVGKSQDDMKNISTDELWSSVLHYNTHDKVVTDVLSKRLSRTKADIKTEIAERRTLESPSFDVRRCKMIGEWIMNENYEKLTKYQDRIDTIYFYTYKSGVYRAMVRRLTTKMYKFLEERFEVPKLHIDLCFDGWERSRTFHWIPLNGQLDRELIGIAFQHATEDTSGFGEKFMHVALQFFIKEDREDLFMEFIKYCPEFEITNDKTRGVFSTITIKDPPSWYIKHKVLNKAKRLFGKRK